MKKIFQLSITLTLFSFIYSCTNDSEDDLIDQMQNQGPITYTNDVKTIIDNNCLNCHGDPPTNGAPNSLVTYQNVRNSAENGTLLARIQQNEGGPGAMPLGGPRLPQTLIDVVVQWQSDGFVE